MQRQNDRDAEIWEVSKIAPSLSPLFGVIGSYLCHSCCSSTRYAMVDRAVCNVCYCDYCTDCGRGCYCEWRYLAGSISAANTIRRFVLNHLFTDYTCEYREFVSDAYCYRNTCTAHVLRRLVNESDMTSKSRGEAQSRYMCSVHICPCQNDSDYDDYVICYECEGRPCNRCNIGCLPGCPIGNY